MCFYRSTYNYIYTQKTQKMRKKQELNAKNVQNKVDECRGQLRTNFFLSSDQISSSKSSQKILSQQKWTPKELQLLQELYFTQGPRWKDIKSRFPERTQDDLKNKINSSVRKVALGLSDFDGNPNKQAVSKTLLATLKLCFQVEEHVIKRKLTLNKESIFYKLKSSIIRMCFQKQFIHSDLQELHYLTKKINKRIKCFGVYKAKNLKNWVLSENGFKSILQFDKPFIQQTLMSLIQSNNVAEKQKMMVPENTLQIKWPSRILRIDLDQILEPLIELKSWETKIQSYKSPNFEMQYSKIIGTEYNTDYASISQGFCYI